MDKTNIISKIYYDESGFGSIKTTLEDARKVNKMMFFLILLFFTKKVFFWGLRPFLLKKAVFFDITFFYKKKYLRIM